MGLAAVAFAQVQALLGELALPATFVPPRSASATLLAGGADCNRRPHDPSARSSRSESPVALGGVARKTKKVKIAQNIVHVRRLGPQAYSSKPFMKEKKRIEKIAEQDSWVNEFMSYSRPTPLGGEYAMPATIARDQLNSIYGEEPTLQTLETLEEEEENEEREAAKQGVSRKEFRTMNRMRKKKSPNKYGGPRPRKSQFNVGNMPGVSRYIGSLPDSVLRSRPGDMGVRGGAQSDAYQDVWMSGASVSYNFEEEDERHP